MARHPEVPNFIIVFFIKLTQDLVKSNREAGLRLIQSDIFWVQKGDCPLFTKYI